jgi:hypothetical protein
MKTRVLLLVVVLMLIGLMSAAARQDRELQQPPPVVPVSVDSASAVTCYFFPYTKTFQCVGWGYRK